MKCKQEVYHQSNERVKNITQTDEKLVWKRYANKNGKVSTIMINNTFFGYIVIFLFVRSLFSNEKRKKINWKKKKTIRTRICTKRKVRYADTVSRCESDRLMCSEIENQQQISTSKITTKMWASKKNHRNNYLPHNFITYDDDMQHVSPSLLRSTICCFRPPLISFKKASFAFASRSNVRHNTAVESCMHRHILYFE